MRVPVMMLSAVALLAAAGPRSAADVLAGRVAGPPRQCILAEQAGNSTILDANTILFRPRLSGGNQWFVNRPQGCPGLAPGRALSGFRPNSRLCSGDIVQVSEPQTGFVFGSCTLTDFTPYPKAKG